MRPLELRIHNLASLRHDHVVDFTKLMHAPLFAITGETGAGKSTLLNAISLALYGQVYRKGVNQVDLVTLGEREASVQLIFAVRNKRYLADWSATVLRKDGAPLSNPTLKRYLYEFDEQGEKRLLPQAPEEILGLTYDQFCKCVVLNQGEFARFLNAPFTERKEILERLYHGELLDRLSQLARQKLDQESKEKELLEVQLHTLKEQGAWDAGQISKEVTSLESLLNEMEQAKKASIPLMSGVEELRSLSERYHTTRERLDQLQETIKERTIQFNKELGNWNEKKGQLEVWQNKWEKERPLLEEGARNQAELTRLHTLLEQLERQLKESHEMAARLTNKKVALKHQGDDLREQLTKLNQQIHATTSLLQIPDTSFDTLLNLYQNKQDEVALLERIQLELDEIKKIGLELRQEQEKWQKERIALNFDPTVIASKEKELSQLQRQLITQQELQRQLEQLIHKKSQTTVKLDTLKQDFAQTSEELLIKKAQLDEQQWMAQLWQLKEHLLAHDSEMSHCPVCQQGISPQLQQKLTSEWSEARGSGLIKSLEEHQAKVNSLSKKFDQQEIILQQEEKQLRQLDSDIQSLTQLLNLALPVNLIQTITQQEQELIEARRRQENYQQLTEKLSEREKRLEEDRKRFTSRGQEVKKLAEKQAQTLQELNKFKVQWQTLGVNFPEDMKELEQLRRQWRLLREQEQLLHLEAQWSKDWQNHTQEEQQLYEIKQQKQLERGEITQKRDLLAQKIKAAFNGDALELMRAAQENIKKIEHQASLAQNEMRAQEKMLTEVQGRQYQYHEQLKELQLQYAKVCENPPHERLNSFKSPIHEAHILLAPWREELQRQQAAEELQIRQHLSRLSELKTLQQEENKRAESRSLLQKKLAAVQKRVERFGELYQVIGKDELRNFVLSQVELSLIQQTNQELNQLCQGRYEIVHQGKRGRLVPEFWVIDRFKDGLYRKVSTLSGGETFMVSLAMALALAEMARGSSEIECFFIDEGFGTLDEESLDDVLDVLQQIRSRGKLIGLISHVKSLTSRLPLNLHVQKDLRGNSQLSLREN